MTHPNRPLLILDLDETLIYATANALERSADFRVGPFHVYRRPKLDDFLIEVSEVYEIAIWSSASPDYVSGIAREITRSTATPVFIWGRERCTRRYDFERQDEYFAKNLKKVKRLGYDLDRVLIVEDTPQKVERNYGNAIYVSPYYGACDGDTELHHLAAYLKSIVDEQNVRKLEKRGWRTVRESR